jgi:hypothetical protein
MTEVVIDRCLLRVLRTGGWSWGPDPQALLAGAVEALPSRLAEALDELAERHGLDGEVAAPVRVVVPVRLADLRAGDHRPLAAALDAPLRAAVERALPGAVAEPGERADPDVAAAGRGAARPPPEAVTAARTPLEQLVVWWAEGILEELLRGWREPVLLAWAEAVAASPREPEPAAAGPARAQALRAALVAAAARAAARPAALGRRPGVGTVAGVPEPASAPARAGPSGAPGAVTAAPRPAMVEARALPFLMLVALSRLGYLDALGPALTAARLDGHAGALVSALARKALEPPERGWRRTPLDLATAAAIAGAATVDEAGIAALAHAARDFAPVLDGVVTRAVLAGHDPSTHLVLHRGPAGELVLLDPDGSFPVAVGDAAPLAAAVGAPCSAVRVTVSASDPAVLAALDAAGVPFVTAAPPGRSEPWLRAGPGRWTNAAPDTGRRCPPADEAQLDALLGVLERRPGAAPGGLERTLTLAAGVALGMLAWELWHEREATDATVALRRLGDLDARVRSEPGRVRVTIPLGQRHRDLARAGLLRTIPAPWLDAQVELGGG